jgi:antitoxin (DNA-binding transcriptional repressor) of toxin-antitoxin stability system
MALKWVDLGKARAETAQATPTAEAGEVMEITGRGREVGKFL